MTAASKVTLTRIFLIPVYMVLMYVSGGVAGPWMWGALGVFILASVTDFVDGYIARHCNQVSDFGKFLDPLADKLLVIAATVIAAGWSGKVKTASTMVGLCLLMAFPHIQPLRWAVIWVVVATTLYSGVEYFARNWKCLWN